MNGQCDGATYRRQWRLLLTNETTSGSWLLSLGRHRHKVGSIAVSWQKALYRALDYLEAMPNAQETTTVQRSITV